MKKIIKNELIKSFVLILLSLLFLPNNLEHILYLRCMLGFYCLYVACDKIELYFHYKKLEKNLVGDKNEKNF